MTNLRRFLRRGAGAVVVVMALAGCAAQRPLELACMDRFDIERLHTLRDAGFTAVVTGDGREHTIAVRVQGAGIDEPVCLIASDEPLDADQMFRLAKRQTRKDRLLPE